MVRICIKKYRGKLTYGEGSKVVCQTEKKFNPSWTVGKKIYWLAIDATHDEAYNSLSEKASDHGPFWSNVVDDEGTKDRSGHVEQAIEIVSACIKAKL